MRTGMPLPFPEFTRSSHQRHPGDDPALALGWPSVEGQILHACRERESKSEKASHRMRGTWRRQRAPTGGLPEFALPPYLPALPLPLFFRASKQLSPSMPCTQSLLGETQNTQHCQAPS